MPGQPLCSALASYCKPFRNLTDHLNWQGQGRREGSRRGGPRGPSDGFRQRRPYSKLFIHHESVTAPSRGGKAEFYPSPVLCKNSRVTKSPTLPCSGNSSLERNTLPQDDLDKTQRCRRNHEARFRPSPHKSPSFAS